MVSPHDGQDLVADGRHHLVVHRLGVEPQQRLGVGRAQVEPPVGGTDREPVELVDGNPGPCAERRTDLLDGGGLVCHPTDTVYGVAACADIPAAVERLYVVK